MSHYLTRPDYEHELECARQHHERFLALPPDQRRVVATEFLKQLGVLLPDGSLSPLYYPEVQNDSSSDPCDQAGLPSADPDQPGV